MAAMALKLGRETCQVSATYRAWIQPLHPTAARCHTFRARNRSATQRHGDHGLLVVLQVLKSARARAELLFERMKEQSTEVRPSHLSATRSLPSLPSAAHLVACKGW